MIECQLLTNGCTFVAFGEPASVFLFDFHKSMTGQNSWVNFEVVSLFHDKGMTPVQAILLSERLRKFKKHVAARHSLAHLTDLLGQQLFCLGW